MLRKKILNNLIAGSLVAGSLLLSGAVSAQTVVDKETASKIAEGLSKGKKKIGETITEIRTTPVQGLYEVRYGTSLLYASADGNYVFQGQLVDVQRGVSLTQEYIDKLTAINFKDIPVKDAIVTVVGNGKRKIAVFEDPNCGYCKLFAKEVKKLENVTVYTFLYPILSADSLKKSNNVWCAKDKSKVWYDWMDSAIVPPDATCAATPIDRNLAFGKKYNITGTPTIVFEDGYKSPGVMKAEDINKKLDSIKSGK